MIFNSKPQKLFSNPELKGETVAYFKQKIKILVNNQYRGLETEKKKAQKIENFLNAIKKHEYKKKNFGNIIEEDLFNQLVKDLPQDLFKKRHSKVDLEKDFDDIFEKELNIFLNKMTSKNINFLEGTEPGTTLINKDNLLQDKIIDYIAIGIENNFKEGVINDINKLSSNIFKVPVSKEQKSDFGVHINIETQVKDEYKKIMELFNNKSFSLKNYFAGEDQNINIHLGHTNPLKSISGALIDLGASEPIAVKAFYASTAVYYREQGSEMGQELAFCIYALRSYYEITGAGLKIDGIPISKVDFVIVNNPNGNIRVVSSKELLLSILLSKRRDNKNNNPFRDISATIPIGAFNDKLWYSIDDLIKFDE